MHRNELLLALGNFRLRLTYHLKFYREMYVRTVNSGQLLTLQILDIVGMTEVPAGLQSIPTLNG